jgi:pyruvate dehydrogenase E2 component (dihydrolipoamide acetyltransferase)
MPTNILMPALSPTMEKGNLARWLKKEGDKIRTGDVIAEIETDKATMEYEAVDDGTLAKIVVPEGTHDVPVNSVIAVLAGEGEDVKAAADASADKKVIEPKPSPHPAAFGGHSPSKGGGMSSAVPSLLSSPASGKEISAPQPYPRSGEGGAAKAAPGGVPVQHSTRVFSSPLARRLAKEVGIDLSRVQGSGPHGRVIARDIAEPKTGLRAPSIAPAAAPASAPLPGSSLSDAQIRSLFEDGSYEIVPHDNMRRTIAQRLTASVQTIPHFYVTVDCNIGKLLAAREEINTGAPVNKDGKPAYKLSVNDFIIKALALALQRVPNANVSWTEGGMLRHRHSDVGVAVALPAGLITPIIRKAETKSLSVISNEMRDLAERARARKLRPDEYQGGTTSVSNLGMYGIKDFTAVINPPQSTILAVGAGEERAIAVSGKIEIATIMSVTLSCDHRSVDGALGAELIGAFKTLIENPVLMMV